jgi:hypothetical protein
MASRTISASGGESDGSTPSEFRQQMLGIVRDSLVLGLVQLEKLYSTLVRGSNQIVLPFQAVVQGSSGGSIRCANPILEE